MATRQTTIRLTESTERQIEELTARGFGSFSDIVRVAVDRMHQQEAREMGRRIEVGEEHIVWWDGPGYYAEIPRRAPSGETQLMRLSTAYPEAEASRRGWRNPRWLSSASGAGSSEARDGDEGEVSPTVPDSR